MSVAHESLVVSQFGPRARAYVESADHATGADLDRLRALVAARPGGRVLDLGCGGGHVSFAAAPQAREVIAYDLSAEMLAAVASVASQRGLTAIRTQQGRAEDLPFEADGFDIVATRFSAHHWWDLPAALAEMRRVLKPGGLAIVMDSASPGPPRLDTSLQAIELLRDPSHVRDYSADEWLAGLRAAGLRPRAPVMAKLRLDFAGWVARIGTPALQVAAIRTLQAAMPDDVRAHFAIEPDGSFLLDTLTIEAEAAP